jgi:hypothetical protein
MRFFAGGFDRQHDPYMTLPAFNHLIGHSGTCDEEIVITSAPGEWNDTIRNLCLKLGYYPVFVSGRQFACQARLGRGGSGGLCR